MSNDNLDPITGRRVPGEGPDDTLTGGGSTPHPDLGPQHPTVADPALALDDQGTVPAGSGQSATDASFASDVETAGLDSAGSSDAEGPTGSTGKKAAQVTASAKGVAGHAADRAVEVKDAALEKAGEVKDVALERGTEVAGVAKDELARLAGEARTQFQGLWHQASGQLREQAGAGQQQLADLLHSLSSELGEMASKSGQDGPLTALAKQASYRGGELSHWLANAEASDVVTEIKRFARRRPFAFLAGAAVAGVVVGRLSRGLMAANDNPSTASSGARAATDATGVPAPVVAEDVGAYGGGTTGQTYGYTPAGGPA
jgi:hypothetical protein